MRNTIAKQLTRLAKEELQEVTENATPAQIKSLARTKKKAYMKLDTNQRYQFNHS